ncbi:MAG: hypothetical protein GY940_06300 [bacterium]|nr:hypothetical protein [bacterium]
MIPQKDNSSSIERVLSFHSYRIYPYLKEELFALIGKAGNVSDKYSMAPDFQSFSEGIERKLSVRSNKIKFSVFFLLSGALILFFDQLKPIVDSGIAGKYTISFFQFIFLDLGEVIVGTGAFLVIIFFLSLIGHFSIKKESNLIIDETENIISTVYKIKAKEE